MLLRFVSRLVAAGAFLGVGAGLAALAQDKKAAEAVILAPKSGATVGQMEEVEGQVNVKDGWPVVLVQPVALGEPWYVQEAIDALDKGKFTAKVHFGDDQAPDGTKFRVVVLVAKNKEEAAKFEVGLERKDLPAKLPRSEVVEVVLKK